MRTMFPEIHQIYPGRGFRPGCCHVQTDLRGLDRYLEKELERAAFALLDQSDPAVQQYERKNSTDSAMIIDAMDILYSGNVEGFCLVSSDSDFTKLARRLRESGMFVLGMGEQKTLLPSALRAMPLKFSKSFPRTRTISPLRLPLSRKIRRATALLRTNPFHYKQGRNRADGFPCTDREQ